MHDAHKGSNRIEKIDAKVLKYYALAQHTSAEWQRKNEPVFGFSRVLMRYIRIRIRILIPELEVHCEQFRIFNVRAQVRWFFVRQMQKCIPYGCLLRCN